MRDVLGNFRAFLENVIKGVFVEPVTLHVFQCYHGRRALITRHQRHLTEKVSRLQYRYHLAWGISHRDGDFSRPLRQNIERMRLGPLTCHRLALSEWSRMQALG